MRREPEYQMGQRVVVTRAGHPRCGEEATVIEYTTATHPLFTHYRYYLSFDTADERGVFIASDLRAIR